MSEDDWARNEDESEWEPLKNVLKKGAATLFSVEEIVVAQEEQEPVQIIPRLPDPAPPAISSPQTKASIDSQTTNSQKIDSSGTKGLVAGLAAAIALVIFSYLSGKPRPDENRVNGSSPPDIAGAPAGEIAGPLPAVAISPTPTPARLIAQASKSPRINQAIAPKPATKDPLVSEAPAQVVVQTNALPPMSLPGAEPPVSGELAEAGMVPPPAPPEAVPAQLQMAQASTAPKFVPAEISSIFLPAHREVTVTSFNVAQTAAQPRAAFVLCVESKENVNDLVKNKTWQTFARENQLLFIVVAFDSDEKLIKAGRGFLKAELGSGELLLKGLQEAYPRPLPLILAGRGRGAEFCGSFLGWKPKSAILWATYANNLPVDSPLIQTQAPGLVICDRESLQRANSKVRDLFANARKQEKVWTLLSLAGEAKARSAEAEGFVRQYVAAALKENLQIDRGTWVGVDNFRELNRLERMAGPKDAAWLPSSSLVGAWTALSRVRVDGKPVILQRSFATRVPAQPNLDMYLRLPASAGGDGGNVAGVLAFCTWEKDQTSIIAKLGFQNGDKLVSLTGPEALVADLIKFAEKHNLALLTWGTAQAWNVSANTDELARKAEKNYDHNFDLLAVAWERGVKSIARETGIPSSGYLLYGISRGGQWSHRLALRRPEFFLAVHAHIASSFDVPTPEASKVLWLVTTGELESGYERAQKFYLECRQMRYPIIFKAIIGLGHEGSAIADNLGRNFFEYALSIRKEREHLEEQQASSLARMKPTDGPWLDSFRMPPFVGDIVNQECFPSKEMAMVPERYRVPLPTESLAKAWSR